MLVSLLHIYERIQHGHPEFVPRGVFYTSLIDGVRIDETY